MNTIYLSDKWLSNKLILTVIFRYAQCSYKEKLYLLYNSILINNNIGFIAANHFRLSNQYYSQMSKTLLYNDKNKENKQFKISEVLAEEQYQEE